MNFPAIVSPTDCSPRALHADNIMTFGFYDAALILKKRGFCFSLAYFFTFGRMPRR